MALSTLSYKTDADVVKTEGTNRISRDEGILASGTAANVSIPGSDGATDFIVGDGFDITVAIGSGKYAPFNLTGNNGSEKPVAILLETVDASAADKRVVLLARHAEVVLQSLVWPAGINATQKAAALAALETKGIVARMGV
jgi:hypothetical protein